MPFRQIDPNEYDQSPFRVIGRQWLLITLKNGDTVNAMTASWGGMGILWHGPAAYVFIRPQRFSRQLMDQSERFSLCVLDETRRADLNYLGTVSGRDEDKIKKTGLTTLYDGDTPYFGESNTVFLCKKLYSQPLELDRFTVEGYAERFYPENDAHILYVGGIEKILVRAT